MNALQHVYFTLMTAYMNGLQNPISCPIQDLTKPHSTWNFPATMACRNSQNDGNQKAERLNMPIGSECTYTFTCPFDAASMARKSRMVCGKSGKWIGELPECTNTDELADAIMDIFDRVVPGRTEQPNDEEAPTQIEEEVAPTTPEISVTTSSAKKSKAKDNQIKKLCDRDNMCSKLRSTKDCPKIVPKDILNIANKKFSQKLYQIFTGLCFHCFKNFCSKSVTLL